MIVFTMAGQSRRFADAGYKDPKWMLPIAGRPMLEWAILSFARFFDSEHFVFVFRGEVDSKRFIKRSLKSLDLPSATLVETGGTTRGQAETLDIALEKLGAAREQPFLAFNIDTLIPNFELPQRSNLGDGWIQCVEADGDDWSFVSPIIPGSRKVAGVEEKSRISPFCSTGAYYFGASHLFRDSFNATKTASTEEELFVAPLYKALIQAGRDVYFDLVPRSSVFFCGTPAHYKECVAIEDELVMAYEVK